MTTIIGNDPTQLVDLTEIQRLEQEGPDKEFQLNLKPFDQEATHTANKCKAFIIMHNH